MREYVTLGVRIAPRPFLKLFLPYYAIYAWYYGFLVTLDDLQTQHPMQPPFFLVFFSFSIASALVVNGITSVRRDTRAHEMSRLSVAILEPMKATPSINWSGSTS